jgi:hypothetical protein
MTASANVSASILGYREFLKKRDGEADLFRASLSTREQFFSTIEDHPVQSKRSYDRDVFLRNVTQAKIDDGLGPEMLWLIFTARANQSERFGVELARLYGKDATRFDAPEEEIHPQLQEVYHTRMLADVVGIFGLPVPCYPPPLVIRSLIKLMIFNPFPESFARPLVGASEMLGCMTFRLLRDRGLELFADEPAVADRIRLLFDEILADEICHVGLIQEQLGPIGRRAMHAIYRGMARAQAGRHSPLPEIFGAQRVAEIFDAPFELRRMARQFPDRAYEF